VPTIPLTTDDENENNGEGHTNNSVLPVRLEPRSHVVTHDEYESFAANTNNRARSQRTLPLTNSRSRATPSNDTRREGRPTVSQSPSAASTQRSASAAPRTPTRSGTNRTQGQGVSSQRNQTRNTPSGGRRLGTSNDAASPNPGSAAHRQRSINIRRAGQSSQASAMIRTNRNSVVPIYKGDMATIFPQDNRDQGGHSRNGVEGIVINSPRPPGYAIAVVTKFGVMGYKGKRGFVPNQRYNKAHETHPLDATMGNLKREVVSGTFDIASHTIRSMREIGRRSSNLGNTNRPERRRCGCKENARGTCSSNQCGCRSSGMFCNARCGCRGNCTNSAT
jgi:hypothetical protein